METEALEELVSRAYSRDEQVRDAAQKEILELPDEALLQLLARSGAQTPHQGSRRLSRTLSVWLYVAFGYAIAFAFSKDPSAGRQMKWLVDVLGIGLLVALLMTVWTGYTLPWSQRGPIVSRPLPFSMLLLLAGRKDSRFLPYVLSELAAAGSLFERTRAEENGLHSPLWGKQSQVTIHSISSPYQIRQIRTRYRKLLRDMLAQVGDETPALSPDQHHALLTVLQMPEEDVDCAVSILNYLQQWGKGTAIPVLKGLLREDHWYVGSERVEEAVRHALESVETRHQLQKQGKTLLRPSHETEAVAPQSLLRPTSDIANQAPEQLLRPGRINPPDENA